MKSKLKRVAKTVIALVVIVGLVLATRNAVRQWKVQEDAARGRIAKIEQSIESATSDQERRALRADLEKARAQVPDLVHLNWLLISLAAVLYGMGLIPGGFVLYEATRVLGYRVRVS